MTWKLHAPYRGVAKIVFRFDDGTTATIQPDADGRFEAPEIACPLAAIATKEYPTSWAPRRAWGRRILLRFYSGGSGENSMRLGHRGAMRRVEEGRDVQSSGEFRRENEKLCLFNSHRCRRGERRDPYRGIHP
jgi:hypothetical protein